MQMKGRLIKERSCITYLCVTLSISELMDSTMFMVICSQYNLFNCLQGSNSEELVAVL